MGTKPKVAHYLPTLRVFAVFQHNKDQTPEATRKSFEKVIDDTAKEYPWYTDCYLVSENGISKFERFNGNSSTGFLWMIQDKYDNEYSQFELKLSLSCAIKGSQIISIIRHGEMLGRIISARCPALLSLIVHTCFEAPAYEIHDRTAEPGDIVERKSQPGKYYYFDQVLDGGMHCELITIENIWKPADHITTLHNPDDLRIVDHIPLLSADERLWLLNGNGLGNRDFLIAKWRV